MGGAPGKVLELGEREKRGKYPPPGSVNEGILKSVCNR